MNVQIQHNLDRLAAGATADARAFPAGVAQGLTWTMAKVRRAEIDAMRQRFDRPTRWTLNSAEYKPATPQKLEALVWLQETGGSATGLAPASYLEPQIIGGSRKTKRFEKILQARGLMPSGWFAVPGNGAKLDRYGNLSGPRIVEILSGLQAFREETFKRKAKMNRSAGSAKRNRRARDYFAITGDNRKASNGGALPMGIYERKRDGSIVTVLRFRPRVGYERRLPFFQIADAVVQEHRDKDIRGALKKQLKAVRSIATGT